MINALFVYGTLCPGQPNEHMLTKIGGTWEVGTVRGTLHPEGWGATMGYPAIMLDPTGSKVSGYVFRSDKLSDFWEELDVFEGEEYERVLTEVEVGNDRKIKAFIYTLKKGITQ